MKTTHLLSPSPRRHLVPLAGSETKQFVTLGEKRGWEFLVLGRAPLPTEPVRMEKWLIVPAEQDTSHIPARALERVQAIYEAGMRPKGFVLVHEAPMVLSSGQHNENKAMLPDQFASVLPVIEGVLGGVVASGLIAIAAALLLAAPLTLFAGAMLLDPILIAVTEDGYWIEIDRWNEPAGGV